MLLTVLWAIASGESLAHQSTDKLGLPLNDSATIPAPISSPLNKTVMLTFILVPFAAYENAPVQIILEI